MYVNHNESTCVKPALKTEDHVEPYFAEPDANARKRSGSFDGDFLSSLTADVSVKIKQEQNTLDDKSNDLAEPDENCLPDGRSTDLYEQLELSANSEPDLDMQSAQHAVYNGQMNIDPIEQNNDFSVQSSFECEMCGMKFRSKLDITKHRIILHSSPDVIFCDLCERLFTTITDRDAHRPECALKQQARLTKESNDCVRCDLCDRAYKTDAIYRQHMRRKHNQSVDTFKCNLCHVSFSKQCWLLEHQCTGNSTEIGKQSRFECKICRKDFVSKQSLQRHQFRLHPKIECKTCKQHFNNREERDSHKVECTKMNRHFESNSVKCENPQLNESNRKYDSNDKKSKCARCSTVFANESLLRSHDCTSKDAYFCSKCNKNFSGSGAFRLHQLRFHTPIELNGTVCKICGHLFSTVDEREKHQLDCAVKKKMSQQKLHGELVLSVFYSKIDHFFPDQNVNLSDCFYLFSRSIRVRHMPY